MSPRMLSVELEGSDLVVVVDGKRIAKRDQHEKTWFTLEPGYVVSNSIGGNAIDIEYDGGNAPIGSGDPFSVRMNTF